MVLPLALTLAMVKTDDAAAYPSYLILRAPAADWAHHGVRGHYPGYAISVCDYGCSYGWFEAPSRRHVVEHHGWYENYTEFKY